MKQKIVCPCNNTFFIDYEEDLYPDTDPELTGRIMDGTFMNYPCSKCGKILKPEFPITIVWTSKKVNIEVIPEMERGSFYRRKKDPPGTETVIGYPEMAERIAVLRDGLEPAAVEAIKYLLYLKADENYPDNDISIWYQHTADDILEFHIHGLREKEVAVTRIPLSLYQKTLADFKKKPKSGPFSDLRHRSYLSIQNILWPQELK